MLGQQRQRPIGAWHDYAAAGADGVPSLTSGVMAIAAGALHACALTSAGAVQCWGYNANGQIGDGTPPGVRPFPASVIGFFAAGAPTIGTAAAGNAQATVAFAAPASNGGSAITNYTATSNPGSITGSCTAPCTSITVTGLSNGTAYTFTVTATNGIGTSSSSGASNAVTPVAPQTLMFGTAPSIPKNTTGVVSATSAIPNSGNPIVFTSLTPGVCSVSGGTVTGTDVGTCVIAANQAGDVNFNAAAQVTQNITIGAALCRLDVDGDTTFTALIDGQLLIRHLLGISGPSLTAAIPTFPLSAQRTSDLEISSYLNTLDLDIDGSGGAPLAATDGMIVPRAMLGFRGAAVTAGLPIPGGALRPDWTTIGPYLSGTCLMPVAP